MKKRFLIIIFLFSLMACKPEIEEVEPVLEINTAVHDDSTTIDERETLIVEIEEEAQFAGSEDFTFIRSGFYIPSPKEIDSLVKAGIIKADLKTPNHDKK